MNYLEQITLKAGEIFVDFLYEYRDEFVKFVGEESWVDASCVLFIIQPQSLEVVCKPLGGFTKRGDLLGGAVDTRLYKCMKDAYAVMIQVAESRKTALFTNDCASIRTSYVILSLSELPTTLGYKFLAKLVEVAEIRSLTGNEVEDEFRAYEERITTSKINQHKNQKP